MRHDLRSHVEVDVQRWRPALLSFFLKRVRDRAEAEDLTQETFARLCGGGASPASGHSGYIFQIAANLLRDRARRADVRTQQADTVCQLYGNSVDLLDPERITAAKSAMAQVFRALADLPARTRAVFILYRIENVEQRTIARTFGISPSAVEKHVARATAHLMAMARGLSK